MQVLTDCYDQHMNQAHRQFPCKPLNYDAIEADLVSQLADVNGFESVSIHSPFSLAKGPITPDHIVYMKALSFDGVVTRRNLEKFTEKNGYFPKVIKSPTAIYILGKSSRDAMLALEILQDATQVMLLAQTFGGIDYMTDRATAFIENWEVESYRRKQALKQD
jgi:rhamnose utilization protein RhaD (predicted bifunctional aldolase and dehydrogenase)